MTLKNIKSIGDIKGKNILVRLDLNVHIRNDKVADSYRIDRVLPTIKYLTDKGARLILMSHRSAEGGSLKPVHDYLEKYIKVSFLSDCVGDDVSKVIRSLSNGDVVLLENLRFHKEEIENDYDFAEQLASLGDIYINEAFSVSHRAHASIALLPSLLPSYIGFVFEEEIEGLSKSFSPEHPFLFVLGGAKFDTKLPLVKKFLSIADDIFIGGGLANDFFKVKKFNVGKSIVSDLDLSDIVENSKIILPTDVIVQNGSNVLTKKPNEVSNEEKIVDAGPESLLLLLPLISKAKFILWNGPVGIFEDGFDKTTLELAKFISESKAYSIVGGGDTLAAVKELNLFDKFSFVSTGGGAMLEFLATGTLPGIEALEAGTRN